MQPDFKDAMSILSDLELVKIVTILRNEYQPLAVEAAEKEIKNRFIDPAKFEAIKNDIEFQLIQRKEKESTIVGPLIRLIHFVIDMVVVLVLISIVAFLAGDFFGDIEDENIVRIIFHFSMIITFFGYYTFMEFKYQRTVGKFFTKTRVISINGEKPTIGIIIIRTLCRIIPFDRLSFIFTTNGFHDRLSNTTVIKDCISKL
jgi:uncharacterized RDD family membrane protein YckC